FDISANLQENVHWNEDEHHSKDKCCQRHDKVYFFEASRSCANSKRVGIWKFRSHAFSSETLTRHSQTGLKHPSDMRFWCRTCLVVLATRTLKGGEKSAGRMGDLSPGPFVSRRLNFFVVRAAPRRVFSCYSMKGIWRVSAWSAACGCGP